MKPVPAICTTTDDVPATTLDGEIEIVPGAGLLDVAPTVMAKPPELCFQALTITDPETAPAGTTACMEVDVEDSTVPLTDVLLAPWLPVLTENSMMLSFTVPAPVEVRVPLSP